jgi:hypothetical protein
LFNRDEYLGYFFENDAIREDFDFLTADRKSKPPKSVNVLGHENIFIEEGAKLEFVTLNALSGPIYIGKDAEIMEGSVIPLALCEGAVVKMAAKVYGAHSRTSFQNWRRGKQFCYFSLFEQRA